MKHIASRTALILCMLGFAVIASAQTATTKDPMPQAPTAQKVLLKKSTKKGAPCVIDAVIAREDALISANTARVNSVVTALKTRKTELIAAWNLTDVEARKKARIAALKKFDQTNSQIQRDFTRSVEKAFPNFNVAVNACGVDYSEMPKDGVVTTKGTQ